MCKRTRIAYLDILRVASTFLIIVIHVSGSQPWYRLAVTTASWQWCNIWDGLSRFSVPIFVMISGVLFLNPRRPLSVQHLFSKNIRRIFTAYWCWSVIYLLYDVTMVHHIFQWSYFLEQLIMGSYHMWFLIMIICLYIEVPILRLITENDRWLRYFLLWAVIFACLIPSILVLMKAAKPLFGVDMKRIYHALKKVYRSSWCQFFCGFTMVYLGGYWLSQQQFTRRQRQWLYAGGVLGLIYTVAISSWLSRLLQRATGVAYSYTSWNVLITAAAVFVWVKQHWQTKTSPSWLAKIANLTFGVYLVHILIFYLLTNQLHVQVMAHNPAWFVPCFSLLVFVLSLVSAYLLSLIPWVRKHVI